ncbi:MAG: immune inhibitor A [Dehalococcoidia bacterium]|nr:MAG: immune inhibitor A [Dehalococcoidia bacterium]
MKSKIPLLFIATALIVICLATSVLASNITPRAIYDDPQFIPPQDNRPDPLTTSQLELKAQAIQGQLHGKGNAYGLIGEVARGQFVELAREGEDPVWTVLGEFADFTHNSISQPDRSVDNTTIWVEDFNREYYLDILFNDSPGANSMRNYFIEQSSNRYTVYGDVTDWIQVSGNAADYDDGDPGPGDAYSVWQFLIDSLDGWYDAQIAAGMTPTEIDEYLSGFDVWDRYDWDMDGNFNEPDGYIDHFQSVHAGLGNEAGGGALGDDAIWSHSWFAYFNLIGVEGPSPDFLIGGVQIGESSYWVNKYTIQPENGGVGVFTHEYAHDLGLPDLYDYTGENGTGFWTLMSSGSWLSDGIDDIGSKPSHMGAWEKFQLGWLNYEVAFAGTKSEHKLGPMETNTKQAQGVFVVLPPKMVTEIIADPYDGDYFYYSGAGNNLDNLMYKEFNLAAGSSLAAKANVKIEVDWDYAYLIVSTDGGATWESVETNLSTTTDPNGQNFGYGITGSSSGWIDLTADLSAYTGDVLLGFRYWTDVAVAEPGFMIDEIIVTGYPTDGAETDTGWTFVGFNISTGEESGYYSNYYLAEYRTYWGYDSVLRDGPYNWGFQDNPALENFVERFPYQDGLLISYWDNSFTDNNVGAHVAAGRPGGLLLPIDAHPEAMVRPDLEIWRNRIQTFDSTFTLDPTDELNLNWDSVSYTFESQPAVSIFDDTNTYWDPINPMGSVPNPNTGTIIQIRSISAKGNFMQIQIRPVK